MYILIFLYIHVYTYICYGGILRGLFLAALTAPWAFFLRSFAIRRWCSTSICKERNIDSCRIEDWLSRQARTDLCILRERVPAVKAASTSTRHVWIFCRASVPAGRCGAAERRSIKVSSARPPDAINAASGTAGATNAVGTAVDNCRAAGSRSREGASADALVPPALSAAPVCTRPAL